MKTRIRKIRDFIEDSIIGILIFALIIFAGFIVYNQLGQRDQVITDTEEEWDLGELEVQRPDYTGINISSVFVQTPNEGSGVAATIGSKVRVSYSIWVYDPKQLKNRGTNLVGSPQPKETEWIVGQKKSFLGEFERYLEGLKPGTRRILVVPVEANSVMKLPHSFPKDVMIQIEIEALSVENID